jgi:hypothetical protein
MYRTPTLFKKTLVIGVIALFIGVCVFQNISGYDQNLNINTIKEESARAPDDYINIYLKFNEGSGNTASDSSGHDYDGTIYGASWVTGYSGYALDFDGSNDYINLNSYAKNYLGFNKTDDIIVSFYFKSTDNNRGVIYSMCRGDGYGYNPGFHVAIAANGTIEVQMWRLMCGILTWSDTSWNDGEWHYVEVYYNGITASPLTYIYVDGTLDGFYEKYVCDFYSDNFKYAQIGRNSHELIDYFDGTLDEFKIIKYAGGNQQDPPIIDGPTDGEVNIEYDYTFTNDDPEEDPVFVQIDWGDGDVTDWSEEEIGYGESITLSHKYHTEQIFCIKARTKDFWHHSGWSECYPVAIGNQAPTAPTIFGPKYGDPNEELTYYFTSSDYEGDDLYYFIDWDDGNNTDWIGPHPSNETITSIHSWSENGTYEIRCKAKDIWDKESDWSSYLIKIGDFNNDTSDIIIKGPTQGRPRITYYYNFTIVDYDGEPISIEIDWGDGTIQEFFYEPEPYQYVTIGHCWLKKGVYIIQARTKDIFGFFGTWNEFKVNIPRSRARSLYLYHWLFDRIPMLKILQNLLILTM